MKLGKEEKLQVLLTVAFILSGFIVIGSLIAMDLEFLGNPNVNTPTWFTTIWYGCSFITLILMYKADQLRTNFVGTIIVFILGPVSLLTFGFMWIFKKTRLW